LSSECTASASIAVLRVMPPTTNFVIAMAMLAAIEAKIARRDSEPAVTANARELTRRM
jgi:hypothetical protein